MHAPYFTASEIATQLADTCRTEYAHKTNNATAPFKKMLAIEMIETLDFQARGTMISPALYNQAEFSNALPIARGGFHDPWIGKELDFYLIHKIGAFLDQKFVLNAEGSDRRYIARGKLEETLIKMATQLAAYSAGRNPKAHSLLGVFYTSEMGLTETSREESLYLKSLCPKICARIQTLQAVARLEQQALAYSSLM